MCQKTRKNNKPMKTSYYIFCKVYGWEIRKEKEGEVGRFDRKSEIRVVCLKKRAEIDEIKTTKNIFCSKVIGQKEMMSRMEIVRFQDKIINWVQGHYRLGLAIFVIQKRKSSMMIDSFELFRRSNLTIVLFIISLSMTLERILFF